jgi:hypothetical protein
LDKGEEGVKGDMCIGHWAASLGRAKKPARRRENAKGKRKGGRVLRGNAPCLG